MKDMRARCIIVHLARDNDGRKYSSPPTPMCLSRFAAYSPSCFQRTSFLGPLFAGTHTDLRAGSAGSSTVHYLTFMRALCLALSLSVMFRRWGTWRVRRAVGSRGRRSLARARGNGHALQLTFSRAAAIS